MRCGQPKINIISKLFIMFQFTYRYICLDCCLFSYSINCLWGNWKFRQKENKIPSEAMLPKSQNIQKQSIKHSKVQWIEMNYFEFVLLLVLLLLWRLWLNSMSGVAHFICFDDFLGRQWKSKTRNMENWGSLIRKILYLNWLISICYLHTFVLFVFFVLLLKWIISEGDGTGEYCIIFFHKHWLNIWLSFHFSSSFTTLFPVFRLSIGFG